MFISKEAIFRKEPKITSEIIDILPLNTKIEVLELIENKEEKYCKVNYNEKIGFVLNTSLNTETIENISENNCKSITKDEKIKMIKEAFSILNQNTSYSAKLNYKYYENGKTRVNGYYNIPYYENKKEYYSYDCSAFCDTILNRTFKLDMRRVNDKSKVEINQNEYKDNLWVTKDYLENAKKEDMEGKILYKVQSAENKNDEIKIPKLEIGDFIVGIIDFNNEKHNKKYIMNHIMMYIGDSYVIHASYTNGEVIFNKVLLTKMTDDFYTKVSFEKRFDKEIIVARILKK